MDTGARRGGVRRGAAGSAGRTVGDAAGDTAWAGPAGYVTWIGGAAGTVAPSLQSRSARCTERIRSGRSSDRTRLREIWARSTSAESSRSVPHPGIAPLPVELVPVDTLTDRLRPATST